MRTQSTELFVINRRMARRFVAFGIKPAAALAVDTILDWAESDIRKNLHLRALHTTLKEIDRVTNSL